MNKLMVKDKQNPAGRVLEVRSKRTINSAVHRKRGNKGWTETIRERSVIPGILY